MDGNVAAITLAILGGFAGVLGIVFMADDEPAWGIPLMAGGALFMAPAMLRLWTAAIFG